MESRIALEKLRHICSRQEKCPADVTALMKRWDVDHEFHAEIIDKLRDEGFIDEYRYASAFVKDKCRFDHWGIIKIRYFLHQKGISGKVAETAVSGIDRDEYRNMVSRELSRKQKTLKGSPYEIRGKLIRYGLSRGYEMEIMRDFLGGDSMQE